MKPSPRALRILAVALGLGASLLAGCSPQEIQQQQVEKNLRYGALPKAQIGDTKAARAWADRAIAVDPTDPGIYADNYKTSKTVTVADVFALVGDDPTLVAYMKQAQAKFPDNRWVLETLAAAQRRTGDIAGQRATAARLVSVLEGKVTTPGHTPDMDAMGALAEAYWDAGNEAKAVETYTNLVKVYPREPEALNRMAYAVAVHDSKPHLADALAAADKALRLARTKPTPEWFPGSQDQYASGIQDTLGWVQYRMGNYKSALLNLQQASGANPREAESRYHLAMVYKALGNTEAARVELTHATLLSKGYTDAARELKALPPAPAEGAL